MKFLKENLLYLFVTALLLLILLVPDVRNFLQNTFFPVAKIENAVKISDTDYDLELKGINTADSNLKNFRGKTVFLNFWGTWCPPCRQEWPTIQKLYELRRDKLDFVLIAMEDKEEDVRKFLSENHYSVPVYIAKSPISDKILPKSFPTTFILDRTGRIVAKEDYAKDWKTKSVLDFIDTITK